MLNFIRGLLFRWLILLAILRGFFTALIVGHFVAAFSSSGLSTLLALAAGFTAFLCSLFSFQLGATRTFYLLPNSLLPCENGDANYHRKAFLIILGICWVFTTMLCFDFFFDWWWMGRAQITSGPDLAWIAFLANRWNAFAASNSVYLQTAFPVFCLPIAAFFAVIAYRHWKERKRLVQLEFHGAVLSVMLLCMLSIAATQWIFPPTVIDTTQFDLYKDETYGTRNVAIANELVKTFEKRAAARKQEGKWGVLFYHECLDHFNSGYSNESNALKAAFAFDLRALVKCTLEYHQGEFRYQDLEFAVDMWWRRHEPAYAKMGNWFWKVWCYESILDATEAAWQCRLERIAPPTASNQAALGERYRYEMLSFVKRCGYDRKPCLPFPKGYMTFTFGDFVGFDRDRTTLSIRPNASPYSPHSNTAPQDLPTPPWLEHKSVQPAPKVNGNPALKGNSGRPGLDTNNWPDSF